FLLCPFLLLAALGVVLWGERRSWAMLAVGGLALGAGTTIKPHGVIFGLALLFLLLLAPEPPRRARWTAAAVLAVSMTVVPFGLTAWLGAIGALAPWRDIVVHYLVPFYSRLGKSASWTVFRWSLWPAIAVVLVLSVGHALAMRRFTFRHTVVLAGVGY